MRSINPASSEALTRPPVPARTLLSTILWKMPAASAPARCFTRNRRGNQRHVFRQARAFHFFHCIIAGIPELLPCSCALPHHRAICSRVTNAALHRAPKQFPYRWKPVPAPSLPNPAENPSAHHAYALREFFFRIRSSSRADFVAARSNNNVGYQIAGSNAPQTQNHNGHAIQFRNCFGVSAPMRVPSPAAGRIAAIRFMCARATGA